MEALEILTKIGTTALTVVSVVMGIWGLLTHLLRSISMFMIARRRKIKGAWLAWFPITNEWLLGAIGDHYQRHKYGHDRARRGKLLALAILTQSWGLITPLLKPFVGELTPESILELVRQLTGSQIAWLSVGAVVFALAVVVISFIQMILQYKAYYSLFASCKPKAAIPFLIVSIFTPVNPFLVFACRKSDGGMPVQTEA